MHLSALRTVGFQICGEAHYSLFQRKVLFDGRTVVLVLMLTAAEPVGARRVHQIASDQFVPGHLHMLSPERVADLVSHRVLVPGIGAADNAGRRLPVHIIGADIGHTQHIAFPSAPAAQHEDAVDPFVV